MKEFQDGCRIDSWFLLLLLRNVFVTQSDYKELIKVDSVQCSVTFYHAAYVTLTLRTIIYKYRNISFIRMLRTKCSLKLLSGAAASTASPRVFDVGPEEKDIQEPCHCWTPPDLPSSPYATPIYSQCQVHNPHLHLLHLLLLILCPLFLLLLISPSRLPTNLAPFLHH